MTTDAQMSLLGMMLRDRRVYEMAVDRGLTLDCFDQPDYEAVFIAMLDAEKSSGDVDVTAIAVARPELAEPLLRLHSNAPIAQRPEAFVDELLTARWTRHAMTALREAHTALIARKPYDPVEPCRQRIAEVLNAIASTPTRQAQGPKRLSDVLDTELHKIESEMSNGVPLAIPTGILAIDALTSGGLKRGSVNVFAARTGVGKTTLALNIAEHAAAKGFGVCYFTVEMPAGQLARKLVSKVGRIRGTRIMNAAMEGEEFDRFSHAVRQLHPVDFWIDDTFRASFEAFDASCRRLKRAAKLDLVVIDYIQQLTLEGRHQTKQQLVTEVSHRVKQLALELDIAVLSLAQFNREAEKFDGEPSLWQIKDSGAIEQDADLGVCLFRDDNANQGKGQFYLKVDKNRWGKDRLKFPIEADLSLNLFSNANVNIPSEYF